MLRGATSGTVTLLKKGFRWRDRIHRINGLLAYNLGLVSIGLGIFSG